MKTLHRHLKLICKNKKYFVPSSPQNSVYEVERRLFRRRLLEVPLEGASVSAAKEKILIAHAISAARFLSGAIRSRNAFKIHPAARNSLSVNSAYSIGKPSRDINFIICMGSWDVLSGREMAQKRQ